MIVSDNLDLKPRGGNLARFFHVRPSETGSRSPPLPHGRVKAGAAVGVAGRAILRDLQQQAVAITIQPQFHQPLHMARGFALGPEGLTRTRPIGDIAGFQCTGNAGSIHPGHHQNLARGMILRDGGDQTIGIIGKACGVEGHRVSPLQGLRGGLSMRGSRRRKAMSDSDLIRLIPSGFWHWRPISRIWGGCPHRRARRANARHCVDRW